MYSGGASRTAAKRATVAVVSASPLVKTCRTLAHRAGSPVDEEHVQHRRNEMYCADPVFGDHPGQVPRIAVPVGGVASTRVAPVSNGQNSSHTDTSKVAGGSSAGPRRPPSSGWCPCIHSSRLTIPRCEIATPFGRPVEPDVNSTYARSSGRNGARRSVSRTSAPEYSSAGGQRVEHPHGGGPCRGCARCDRPADRDRSARTRHPR